MNGKDSNHQSYLLKPIGYCKSPLKYKNDAPRQATALSAESYIELKKGENFEQALEGLSECSHIWLIYGFHHNQTWKPKVKTPRGPEQKLGLFATRSPYRPNGIGMSCVELKSIKGLKLFIGTSDLLDETPIFDIKPYLSYSDSVPEAHYPWVDQCEEELFDIHWSPLAQRKKDFLEQRGLNLTHPVEAQLRQHPTDKKRTRLVESSLGHPYCFAYRTWRIHFKLNEKSLRVMDITSGYLGSELNQSEDRYQDKDLHREFLTQY